MIEITGTKLQVRIQQNGEEKQKKVNFSSISNSPTEADIIKLGETMDKLEPEGNAFDSVIVTSRTRVTKTEEG